jgi:hypothetical protein
MSDFRQALYYPYIHIKDEAWLKTAALFYDKLCRIQPDGFATDDSDAVKALDAECSFIENVPAGPASQAIMGSFLEYAIQNLKNEGKRLGLNPELRDAIADDSEIHYAKVPEAVAEQLKAFGLMKAPKRKDFYNFEPATATVYMTFLANRIAADKGIAVVTDDPAYFPFLVGAKGSELIWESSQDQQFALANLVLRERLPDTLSVKAAPLENIIEFRKKHDDERKQFMDAISGLVRELQKQKVAPEAMEHGLREKYSAIEKGYKDYKAALKGTKIKLGTTLLAMSFPAWIGHFGAALSGTANVPIMIGTVMVGAMFTVGKFGDTVYEYYKTRATSPWSYIHSIEKTFGQRKQFQELGVAADIQNNIPYFGY